MDRERVKRDWANRGFSCDLCIDPPGHVWTDSVHDKDELVLLVEGEEEFEMCGKKFASIRKGHAAINPSCSFDVSLAVIIDLGIPPSLVVVVHLRAIELRFR